MCRRFPFYVITICYMLFTNISFAQQSSVLSVKTKIDTTILVALYNVSVFYPELEGTHVTISYSRIKTTLNCRPSIFSVLFQKKSNRLYKIRINSSKSRNGIVYDSIPMDAKNGLWAHELAHISDYKTAGIGGIIKRLFWYTSKTKKEAFEKSIDLQTIKHGAGFSLLKWSQWVLEHSKAPDWYKEYKKRYYLEPFEIKDRL